jgi:hypothetical protein
MIAVSVATVETAIPKKANRFIWSASRSNFFVLSSIFFYFWGASSKDTKTEVELSSLLSLIMRKTRG